ncbi:adenylate/guanylate cyclase domain-containing protein [Magnetospira sp. QH-2]|uniref:adenylate/guanylate cyclase domain-containing protein n=1 Tax=Magnetospira sp. (strain QH-2) TaxID=1288970 RepID=UPI00130DC3FB|nr:adenylate/guanylate cyclase domain-containing protein [Magnetospira sp. QH-2]
MAVVTAFSITVFNQYAGRQAAMNSAHRLFVEVGERAGEHVEHLFTAVSSLARVLPTLAPEGTLRSEDIRSHPLVPGLIETLGASKNTYSAYLGNRDGDFLQMIRMREGMTFANISPPARTSYILRYIGGQEDGTRPQTWYFLDQALELIDQQQDTETTYDPRQRPWYNSAMASETPIATDAYIYNSTGKTGFTLAQRLGNRRGVMGIDITTDSLNSFLGQQKVSKTGAVFLIDDKERLIAHSSSTDTQSAALVAASEHQDAWVASVPHLRPGQQLRTVNNQDILFYQRDALTGTGRAIRVIVAAPIREFMGHLDQALVGNVLFAILAILTAIPIALWVSGLFNRTIQSIAQEAGRIHRLEIRDTELPSTRIKELEQLSNSFEIMRQGLKTFGLYVPKSLVHHILNTEVSSAVGGERQQLTAMFSDIADYTTISEGLEPEELMSMTYRYFDLLGVAIDRRQGIIDKFIGDAIMALWNAPTNDADHVANACFAALECRIGNMVYNLENDARGLPALHTRFGVHCGEAVVGNVGSSDRLNYTAIGSVINLASRLEGVNKVYGTTILVSGEVRDRIGDRFVTRPIDRVAVKGADQPMEICELIGVPWETNDINPILWAPQHLNNLLSLWDEAYGLYNRQEWTRATDGFRAILDAYPNDGPAALYLDRCQQYAKTPPAEDWDGIARMTEK